MEMEEKVENVGKWGGKSCDDKSAGPPMQLWQLQLALWQLPLQNTSLHTIFPRFP